MYQAINSLNLANVPLTVHQRVVLDIDFAGIITVCPSQGGVQQLMVSGFCSFNDQSVKPLVACHLPSCFSLVRDQLRYTCFSDSD